MNTPDGNTISTTEHTCGMIIALSRNIPKAVAKIKSGGWDRKAYMGIEVHGKVLGIVGLGKIGTEVAKRIQAFGMEVWAYDPFSIQEHANELGVKFTNLDDVLAGSDYLSVHTPLTEKTKGLVSLKNADKIKKGMLSKYVSESINLINARVFAGERGFNIKEITSSKTQHYTDLVIIRLPKGAEYKSNFASVFGQGDYRIVEIENYGIELRLEGDIILYQNEDKPGMLASVSGTLAHMNINIAGLSLGRSGKGSNTITAFSIDKQMDKSELAAVSELEGIEHLRYVSLT